MKNASKIALALALVAPDVVAVMPLCSGGENDFLSNSIVGGRSDTTCEDMWDYYVNMFSTQNPALGTNKLTYNKCSALMGASFGNMNLWFFTDTLLAPSCCSSGTSACEALATPSLCAHENDYTPDASLAIADSDASFMETCSDINKVAAFTASSVKFNLLTENKQYNGPNQDKGKVMSRIFEWNKDTCTSKDPDNYFFTKKVGKLLGYGAYYGCCGNSGDDACYESMGTQWQCNLDFARTGLMSDACATGDDDTPSCLADCTAQCDTPVTDACVGDCTTSDGSCEFLADYCPELTLPYCPSARRLAQGAASGVGPKGWGALQKNTKALKSAAKFKAEANALAQSLKAAKATARAAHGRAVATLVQDKGAALGAARASAKAAVAAHEAKQAGKPAAPTTSEAEPAAAAHTTLQAAAKAKKFAAKA